MVPGFAVPVQKFSNFILGNNNSGHHLADILFMFLKQIPQISYYYVRKSTTATKGKDSRQELISLIYSSRQKMVWDTHTVSLDPGLPTSPSIVMHYFVYAY